MHGHVSFALFAVGFVVVTAILVIRARREGEQIERRTIVLSGVTVAVFALPIVVNLIVNFPGEIDDYWRYSRGGDAGSHSIGQVVRFLAQYWSADSLGAVVALGLVLAVALATGILPDSSTRRYARALIGVVALVTVLTFTYAYRGVDDLSFRYVAEFYLTAPVVTAFVVCIVGCSVIRAHPRGFLAAGCAVVVLTIVLATRPGVIAQYGGANWIRQADHEIDQAVAAIDSAPDVTRVYRFDLSAWPSAAGLVEQSRRDGEPVCIDEPRFAFLFTEDMICTASERQSGVLVVPAVPGGVVASSELPQRVVFSNGSTVVSVAQR